MSYIYVLDTSALIAVLANEEGADTIKTILQEASIGKRTVVINKLNLLEVYCDAYRIYGNDSANDLLDTIQNTHITIKSEITDAVFKESGRLRAAYNISIADSIALAEAYVWGGSLLTADHHTFDMIEKSENIRFCWIQ